MILRMFLIFRDLSLDDFYKLDTYKKNVCITSHTGRGKGLVGSVIAFVLNVSLYCLVRDEGGGESKHETLSTEQNNSSLFHGSLISPHFLRDVIYR